MEALVLVGALGVSCSIAVACAVLVLVVISTTPTASTPPRVVDGGVVLDGSERDTNITFFDDPSGFSGVDLYKYKMTWRGHRLYPCAVHHDHAAAYLYSILHVTGDGLSPIYCHVVDMCNRKDQPCDPNKNKGGRGFLVDVHKQGWDAIGKTTGVIAGRCKVVGRLGPKDMPDDVFLKGRETYVMCSCTGRCEESSHRWVRKDDCYIDSSGPSPGR